MFAVLPLNTENVASVFQIVPLHRESDYSVLSFGDWLGIPDELHSQPLKAAGWYVDKGEHCSWRWIVFSLDRCNETKVSDYLLPYVEPPAGVMSYIQWSCSCTCICVTLRGWIKNTTTHFILYKVPASRTVYTDRKLLQKINFSLPVATVYTIAKPQTAFHGDTNYMNHG